MANSHIYPFAQGGGAAVLDTASYQADAHRSIGHQPGVARHTLENKALRQVSAIVAGLARFIADNQATDVTDDLLEAAVATMIANACKQVAASPAGTIVFVPGTALLPQTLKVNGALLSRATYPKLWTYAQSSGNLAASDGAWASGQFSPGDGASTFRIPDYRGYHFRAWDDARGIDVARAIGSVQNDQLLQHSHGVNDPGHGHGINDPGHIHVSGVPADGGSFYGMASPGGAQNGKDGTLAYTTSPVTSGNTTGISVQASGSNISIQQSTGGSEVRVKNIALMPVIYYGG